MMGVGFIGERAGAGAGVLVLVLVRVLVLVLELLLALDAGGPFSTPTRGCAVRTHHTSNRVPITYIKNVVSMPSNAMTLQAYSSRNDWEIAMIPESPVPIAV